MNSKLNVMKKTLLFIIEKSTCERHKAKRERRREWRSDSPSWINCLTMNISNHFYICVHLSKQKRFPTNTPTNIKQMYISKKLLRSKPVDCQLTAELADISLNNMKTYLGCQPAGRYSSLFAPILPALTTYCEVIY